MRNSRDNVFMTEAEKRVTVERFRDSQFLTTKLADNGYQYHLQYPSVNLDPR